MAGKGDKRRKGEDTAKFEKNCPFPSLLDKRKLKKEKKEGNK